jgi:hypothetical protein
LRVAAAAAHHRPEATGSTGRHPIGGRAPVEIGSGILLIILSLLIIVFVVRTVQANMPH